MVVVLIVEGVASSQASSEISVASCKVGMIAEDRGVGTTLEVTRVGVLEFKEVIEVAALIVEDVASSLASSERLVTSCEVGMTLD